MFKPDCRPNMFCRNFCFISTILGMVHGFVISQSVSAKQRYSNVSVSANDSVIKGSKLPDQSEAQDKWPSVWEIHGGVFNCSTATFDVGCLSCSKAQNIRVATYVQLPYVLSKSTISSRCAFSEVQWGGAWIQILDRICRNLSLRCKVYEATRPNGTGRYLASLSEVLTGSADISLSSLTVNPVRLQNYSCIPWPTSVHYSVLIHKRFITTKSVAVENGLFLGVFRPRVWAIFGALILVLFAGMVMSSKLRFDVFGKGVSWKTVLLDISFGQITSSYPDYVTSISQNLPSTLIFTGLCLLSSFIFPTIFNAVIPSQLTLKPLAVSPFSTIQELLLSDFTVYSDLSVRAMMLSSRDADAQQLGTRIIVKGFGESFYEFMAKEPADRGAYLVPHVVYTALSDYTCNIVEAVSMVHSTPQSSLWFRKGDKLHSDFTTRFLQISQSGVIADTGLYYDRLYVESTFRLTNKSTDCLPHPLSNKELLQKRAVRISDLTLPFYVGFGVIGGLGFFLLMLELFATANKCRKRVI